MEKDFSLLRPFDLEKVKAGEAICSEAGTPLTFIGISTRGRVVTEMPSSAICNDLPQHIRMAPLCWVEGKPVYKGDVLYHNNIGVCTANRFDDRLGYLLCDFARWRGHPPCGGPVDQFTWTPPKKTREVKLLGWLTRDGLLMQATENYVRGASWTRVPSEDRTVTVEE